MAGELTYLFPSGDVPQRNGAATRASGEHLAIWRDRHVSARPPQVLAHLEKGSERRSKPAILVRSRGLVCGPTTLSSGRRFVQARELLVAFHGERSPVRRECDGED